MELLKPERLKVGDTVAIVSPSWAGPSMYPRIYENGLNSLRELGLQIKEFPTARATHEILSNNPALRAKDVCDAFSDPEVQAIIPSIGGNDSVRILPFLHSGTIIKNPKIIMGFSDTSTVLSYFNQLGLVTFNGPSVMSGFSQMKSLGSHFKQHVIDILFHGSDSYVYRGYESYHEGYPNWKEEENLGKINRPIEATQWQWLQGSGVCRGQLFGGCVEVFELMKGTDFWPKRDFWTGKIFFLETSEKKPSVETILYALRNYGVQGVFENISALIFGRARDYSEEEKIELNHMIVDVVSREFGNNRLPIITNMDFGHTDPQIILPLGALAELDFNRRTFTLIESWLK